MLLIVKFIFFMLTIICFGFVSLNQTTKIKSLILLVPLSVSFGISVYISACHVLSFFIGPRAASFSSLFILLVITLLVSVLKRKSFTKFDLGINKDQFITLNLIALLICIFTFLAVCRFGIFDKEFHVPLALTLYHNNIYPPRDFFRPDYVLLYHYGGDLLAGAIYNTCKINILRSYELVSTIFSGTTFLSFFALAWLLTKNYKISLLAGFCTYFSGGLLWIDAIFRYLFKKLPEGGEHWGLLQTLFNIGIHGGIINPPSLHTILSTSGIGYPILILSLILFWNLINETDLKNNLFYFIFLSVSLFSLSLTAEWLYTSFLAGVLPFLLILLFQKQKKNLLLVFVLLLTSIALNKTIGNPLFLQDEIQQLGRANIFDLAFKQKLFWITGWGRLGAELMNYQNIFCFSWDFISEFGLSLFLFPIALIYLLRTKNMFALLLFLIPATTMPIPTLVDFKLNPVELNRLFGFGNALLILLITCGIGTLFKGLLQKKIFIIVYLLGFCLSPLLELLSSSIFTPYIYSSKFYVQAVFDEFNKVKSVDDLRTYFREQYSWIIKKRNEPFLDYKDEIEFLKSNSKPGDVAISNLFEIPAYAGVYTIIPSGKWLYKDLLYSFFDSIFSTTLTTLDPYLLKELNIKWILINNDFKNSLPKSTQDTLNNHKLLNLAYTSPKKNQNSTKNWYEIYHVQDCSPYLKNYNRKTAWLLVDKNGQPIEISNLKEKKITLFPSSKDALLYLKSLYTFQAELKKELITSQAVTLESLEKPIQDNNLNIKLDKKYEENNI